MSEATVESVAQIAAEIINAVMAERRDLIKQLHAAKVELAARHHAPKPDQDAAKRGPSTVPPDPCWGALNDGPRCAVFGCNIAATMAPYPPPVSDPNASPGPVDSLDAAEMYHALQRLVPVVGAPLATHLAEHFERFRGRALAVIEEAVRWATNDHHCKPPLGNPTREEAMAEVADLRKQLATMTEAEHALSEAYLRIRRKLNAFDTQTAPTREQVWAHTEEKLDALIRRLAEAKAPRPIDPLTRERIAVQLISVARCMTENAALEFWNGEGAGPWKDYWLERVDHFATLFGQSTISTDYWQRELHSGHTLLLAAPPVGARPGWLVCAKRGCPYTVPSNAWCKVHERMDACWAEADEVKA